jgi:hypothetical protein
MVYKKSSNPFPLSNENNIILVSFVYFGVLISIPQNHRKVYRSDEGTFSLGNIPVLPTYFPNPTGQLSRVKDFAASMIFSAHLPISNAAHSLSHGAGINMQQRLHSFP